MIFNTTQKTKLPNGKKPSYKDLEASFLKVWDKAKMQAEEIKRLNIQNAELRYELNKKDK